ncbi:hypothetical protein V1478_017763 [Vespula squamosa]|uniref:Uncharacterized protein n=1 Tax=Vespula squamosa TaxID=30214 RepID=A0ABD1ZWU4_VESSQ
MKRGMGERLLGLTTTAAPDGVVDGNKGGIALSICSVIMVYSRCSLWLLGMLDRTERNGTERNRTKWNGTERNKTEPIELERERNGIERNGRA